MDHEDFLRAIEADPENDLPRLVYADWLEEQGHPRGKLIRLQCEMEKLGFYSEARDQLRNQVNEWEEAHLPVLFPNCEDFAENVWCTFDRGLPQGVEIREPYDEGLLSIAGHPLIRRIRCSEETCSMTPKGAAALLTLPALDRVSLSFPAPSFLVQILTQHPNLENFHTLEIPLTAEVTEDELRAFGRLPNLKILNLNPHGNQDVRPILAEWAELRMQRWRERSLPAQRHEAIRYWHTINYERGSAPVDQPLLSVGASECSAVDADLEYLSVFPELEKFSFNRTNLRGHGFHHLAKLSNLTTIDIWREEIETIEGLQGMAQLKVLRVALYNGSSLSDARTNSLASLTGLEELEISCTQISDESLQRIGTLSNLRTLELRLNGEFSSKGLSALTALKNLRKLTIVQSIIQNGIDDDSISIFGLMTSLEELHLESLYLSDVGLRHLSSLKKLRWLMLKDNRSRHFTEKGALSLIEEIPGLVIQAVTPDRERKNIPDNPLTTLRGIGWESDWQRKPIDQHASWEMSPIWTELLEPIDHHEPHEWNLEEQVQAPGDRFYVGYQATLKLTRTPASQASLSETAKKDVQDNTHSQRYQWNHENWVYTLTVEVQEDRFAYLEPIFTRMAESMRFE